MSVKVRDAVEQDRPAIDDLVRAAFGPGEGPEIVHLIGELLADPSAQPLLSLVAETDQEVVGHVLFTRAQIEAEGPVVNAYLLAPLAVHPRYQSRGIGSRLVNEGFKRLAEDGGDLVFVLGHPTYYPRFGFDEAGIRGFEAPYPIEPRNAAAWMVHELRPGLVGKVGGRPIV